MIMSQPQRFADRRVPFAFTKWYLDGVNEGGDVCTMYCTHLEVGDLALTWHAVADYPVTGEPQQRWSLARVAAPELVGARLIWEAPALDLSLVMDPFDRPRDVRLLDRADGAVAWHGATMAANLRLERPGQPVFAGAGYAECLSLTIPPWQLPIDTMEWGHWMSDDRAHASTWFRWRDTHPLDRVIEDGGDAASVVIDGARITTANSALEISRERPLERRSLRDIIRAIPLVSRVVPERLLGLVETTWVGRGIRRDADGSTHEGWAIRETVRFR